MSIQSLLTDFKALAKPFNDYQWSHCHDGGEYAHTLIVSGLIHGNETGSLPAIIHTMKALSAGEMSHGGRIIFTLGNPEAALENVRFIESDLNRVFLKTTSTTHEANRARQLMAIFDQADVLIDLHQTILDTNQPFYIFPWTQKSGLWARAIAAATVCVDATPDPTKPTITQCADDYVRNRGQAAVTIELGEKGLNQSSIETAKKAITRSMAIAERVSFGSSLQRMARQEPALTVYETTHREAFGAENRRLRPGLINFMPIQKGERLSPPNAPEIRSPSSGMILFPKYPPPGKALPKEIFRIVTPKESI